MRRFGAAKMRSDGTNGSQKFERHGRYPGIKFRAESLPAGEPHAAQFVVHVMGSACGVYFLGASRRRLLNFRMGLDSKTSLPRIGAIGALASVGIISLEELRRHQSDEIAELHGVGPKAVESLH